MDVFKMLKTRLIKKITTLNAFANKYVFYETLNTFYKKLNFFVETYLLYEKLMILLRPEGTFTVEGTSVRSAGRP